MPKAGARQPTRCYMLVGIGDRALEARQRAQHEATVAFLRANAKMYGWPETLASLSEAERSLLEEMVEDARIQAPDAVTVCKLDIDLHVDAAPRACANFAELCAGFTNKQGVSYTYRGASFHRFVKGFCLQGGDVNGRGGESIYGGTFKDEKSGLKLHHSFGCVSMANSGPNTNRSQFFFCLSRNATNPSIDGKHVVVGQVTNDDGLRFLERLDNELEEGAGDVPRQEVFVVDAGVESF